MASFAESLTTCRELGDRWLSGVCLEEVARLAFAREHYQRAAKLFGAAEELHETLRYHQLPYDKADHDREVAFTRAALGDTAFASTRAGGRAMTLEQAIEYALTVEPN